MRFHTDDAELAVECASLAKALGLDLDPVVHQNALAQAQAGIGPGTICALALTRSPDPRSLVALGTVAQAASARVALLVMPSEDSTIAQIDLARDLGLIAVDETRPLLAALALLQGGAERPWAASLADLSTMERSRFLPLSKLRQRGGGHWTRGAAGLSFALSQGPDATPFPVGETRDAVAAVVALHAASGATFRGGPELEGISKEGTVDTLFGPRRALSDPASKAVLAQYGVPSPTEELCASPSRAASEASRFGYPVRLALVSPDLRIWDHPDLAVDRVDTGAQVRDLFRQMVASAGARQDGARILGVTVGPAATERALLRVKAWPAGSQKRVLMEIGFADAHGLVTGDFTHTVLPAPFARLERVLGRLAGMELLFDDRARDRRATIEAVGTALLRIARFVADHEEVVESVEVEPLVVLLDGSVEVREASIQVSDAFERRLASPNDKVGEGP
ncbi:MAG: acetate--CoA ligase family protein [Myxococcales bacterium]|nr:acetate--CoA ligase family protein [Myxococcales bacterium]